MQFYEKLCKMLTLTETSSIVLARAIEVDPSQISRMKTGSRGRPNNQKLLRLMANYFAARCGSEYRISALAELTGDYRIQTTRSERMLSDAIFAWMSSDVEGGAGERVERFLRRVDSFSMSSSPRTGDVSGVALSKTNGDFVAYHDNDGKRRAVLDLIELLLRDKSSEPPELYVFSDENVEWLTEDAGFANRLTALIGELSARGCYFFRVEPPAQNLDYAFRSIERWLPAYMTGSIRQYYYPHMRDDLHRRTLIASPGHAAVFSRSIGGQPASYMTIFSTDETTVSICCRESRDILKLCRPMIKAYTAADADDMFKLLRSIAAVNEAGIYKSASLSNTTLPLAVMDRICREDKSAFADAMRENLRERATLREISLENNIIEDIMTVADPRDVRAGKVPVLITKMMPGRLYYYTAREYSMHLKAIVTAMERNYNYQVILTDDPMWRELTVYGKANDRVLLIKDGDPFAIFEITEQRFADSLCDFLRQISHFERARANRVETMRRLRELIQQLGSFDF